MNNFNLARYSRKNGTLFLLYSVLAVYSLVTLAPFMWMLITSFKEPSDVFKIPPSFVPSMLFSDTPFANYATVWTERSFVSFFLNSTWVAFMASIGQVFTTSLAGYAFARLELPGKNVLFAIVLATAFVPTEVTIMPEFLMMRWIGWIDTFASLIVPSFLVGAFGTFMLREYFASLPSDYADAAYVDGASPFQIFYKVYLPLAQPALVSVFVIAFINNWNELLRPLLFLNSPEKFTVPLGLMSFVNQYEASWTLLMAGSVISTVPLILIYMLTQRYILQGFVGGGVKG
ncbi:carbohydrate ABC transporter permease [Pacificibacter sp. AS14]|uniref:carbohydrate ABC transporter permease n=1 Tax=Alphaproteobacteria TaxID=28211 RepID=UPI00316C2393